MKGCTIKIGDRKMEAVKSGQEGGTEGAAVTSSVVTGPVGGNNDMKEACRRSITGHTGTSEDTLTSNTHTAHTTHRSDIWQTHTRDDRTGVSQWRV